MSEMDDRPASSSGALARRITSTLAILAFGMSAIALWVAHHQHHALKVTRLDLVDGRGKTRASLALVGGQPWMRFTDERGRECLSLGTYITVKNQGSAASIVAPEGLTCISFAGNGEASLGFQDGRPLLALGDADLKERVRLELLENGAPRLVLADTSGTARASLGVTELLTPKTGATERTAPSSLVLFDKEGKVMVRLPLP